MRTIHFTPPRKKLAKAQKVNPDVLWWGKTLGGDVGAAVYVHRTEGDNGLVDGLIIDNNCLIEETEEDEE